MNIIRQTNKIDAPQAKSFKITIIITEVGSRIEWYSRVRNKHPPPLVNFWKILVKN